jgi:hypothetical protein
MVTDLHAVQAVLLQQTCAEVDATGVNAQRAAPLGGSCATTSCWQTSPCGWLPWGHLHEPQLPEPQPPRQPGLQHPQLQRCMWPPQHPSANGFTACLAAVALQQAAVWGMPGCATPVVADWCTCRCGLLHPPLHTVRTKVRTLAPAAPAACHGGCLCCCSLLQQAAPMHCYIR